MIEPTKYQPILFTTSDKTICCPESNWTHRIFSNDQVNFQFKVGPCPDATEIVQNPEFTDGTAGTQANWTISQGLVLYNLVDSGATLYNDAASITQGGLAVSLDTYYLLKIDLVVNNEEGSINSQINIGGVTFDSPPLPCTTGSYEIYFQASPANFISLTREDLATVPGPGNPVTIQKVSIQEIDFPTLSAIDLDGVELSTDFTAAYNAPYYEAFFQPDLSTQTAECFRIKVERTCDETYTSEIIGIIPDNDCDLLIGACGDINEWAGYKPFIRLDCVIKSDQAPEFERNFNRTTRGRFKMNYGQMTTIKKLYVEPVPEHVRNFIYQLFIAQIIGIKQAQNPQENYFAFDEPEIDLTDGTDQIYGVTMRLAVQDENIEAKYTENCNFILPPKALGSRALNLAIKADTDTGINAE